MTYDVFNRFHCYSSLQRNERMGLLASIACTAFCLYFTLIFSDATTPSSSDESSAFYETVVNAVKASAPLNRLFDLDFPVLKVADAFHEVFYNSARQLGYRSVASERMARRVWKAVASGFEASKYLEIVVNTLAKYLYHIRAFEDRDPVVVAESFLRSLRFFRNVPSSDDPEVYIQAVVDACRHFILNSVFSPNIQSSLTSGFMSELTDEDDTAEEGYQFSLSQLVSSIAPEIFSPAGLSSDSALERINNLAMAIADDIENNGFIDINSFAERLSAIKTQIRSKNPDLKEDGLNIGTRLEGIGALLQVINSADFLYVGDMANDDIPFEISVIQAI